MGTQHFASFIKYAASATGSSNRKQVKAGVLGYPASALIPTVSSRNCCLPLAHRPSALCVPGPLARECSRMPGLEHSQFLLNACCL